MKPILLLLFTFHAITAANLIHETCKKCATHDPNVNYNFCLTSLQASPDSHCANLPQLGLISIQLTRHNVTDTTRYIKRLLNNRKLDPDTRGCLNQCLELYSDAIPSLQKAIKDYQSKHYHDANIRMSAVMDVPTTCTDGFNEKRAVSPSPLKGRNNDTFQLSAIALSIINMLS